MTPGEKLRHLRRAKRLTQYDLGQKVGVKPQSVGQWENNETNPRWTTLQTLDEILDADGEVLRMYGAPFVPGSVAFNGERPDVGAQLAKQIEVLNEQYEVLNEQYEEQKKQIERLTSQLNEVLNRLMNAGDGPGLGIRADEA